MTKFENADLRDIYELARNICLRNRIPISQEIDTVTYKNVRSYWGKCRKKSDGGFDIYINAALEDNRRAMLNTMIHELIHTCSGCMNHSVRWKKYAAALNAAEGLHIRTAETEKDTGVKARPPKVNYAVECENGHRLERERMSLLIKNPEHYICRECRTRFHRVL